MSLLFAFRTKIMLQKPTADLVLRQLQHLTEMLVCRHNDSKGDEDKRNPYFSLVLNKQHQCVDHWRSHAQDRCIVLKTCEMRDNRKILNGASSYLTSVSDSLFPQEHKKAFQQATHFVRNENLLKLAGELQIALCMLSRQPPAQSNSLF